MKSRNIALSSLFGLVISLQKFFLPAPYDKIASVFIQIALLTLAFLITGLMGPLLTSFISGLLTASMRGGLGLMTFSFALLYGGLVGSLNHLLGVVESGHIRRRQLIVSSLISTLLVGVVSSMVSIALGIMPFNPVLISGIMVSGAVQGLVGGYLSGRVWERYFRNV